MGRHNGGGAEIVRSVGCFVAGAACILCLSSLAPELMKNILAHLFFYAKKDEADDDDLHDDHHVVALEEALGEGRRVNGGTKQKQRQLPPELEAELFARVISFFGEDAFPKIRDAFIVVVGLGGVGSHAAHMLARSGVKKLRVIDFDQVTLSSLNRHAVACLSDVGLSKAEVMKDRLQDIIPGLQIEAVKAMMKGDNAEELLRGNPSYVLDCIDDVQTKAELLGYCQAKGLKVIASLGAGLKVQTKAALLGDWQAKGLKVIASWGAGLKADPTRLHIGELDNTTNEPLAIKLRHMLKKKGHSTQDIATVYSDEAARGELLPLTAEQEKNPMAFGVVENLRIRVLPVLGTTPAIFGQSMAAFVLCELAGQPLVPVAVGGLSRAVKHRLLQHLRNRERKVHRNSANDVSMDDVEEATQGVGK